LGEWTSFAWRYRRRTNPEGAKGVAEGGGIPVATGAAVESALEPFGVCLTQTP